MVAVVVDVVVAVVVAVAAVSGATLSKAAFLSRRSSGVFWLLFP